ncbi:MAG: IPTL-CTERM sorting domain-containing protein [Brevundimonas sp.]|uniref:IPTL-CTERM sorting domain-containing protein n=1 Tax=Brevundimonas sp. TaxID=1871086 RepID=UPI0025B9951C|nr:IPTL-CTERM sorting domain-containing protein [Brevundimonas sp.]MBX3478173.1 IPTL-CTERM sorting domain-containing protein [Brevundimonas sp.]
MKATISAVAAAFIAAAAGSAQAQVLTPVPYTVTGSEPALPYTFNGSATPCPPVSPGGSYHYVQIPFTVTVTGSYIPPETGPATVDGMAAIYAAPFDPLNPSTNCVSISDDVGAAMILTAGTPYVLIGSTYNSGATGDTVYTFDGPGAVVLGAPAVVPTLSAWAMILFGGLLLAGGGWMIQRRRLA